jgi:hypothetical protein
MTATPPPTPEERATLTGLAALMIPPGAGLPGAAEVGIGERLLDRVLTVRPDLADPLRAALVRLGDLPPEQAWAWAQQDPQLLDLLGLVVAGGYLMAPEVTDALPYPFAEAKIVDPDDVGRAVHDGLLDAVAARGPLYRLPPDAPAHARARYLEDQNTG